MDAVTDVAQGEPYRTIVDYANAREAGLVVVPTHGRRGFERLLLGSTTDRVVRCSDVPVLTIRPDEDTRIGYPYRNVLVPTDRSGCADHALRTGIGVVNTGDARLHLLSVVNITALGVDVRSDIQIDTLEESADRIIDDAVGLAEDVGIDSPTTAIEYGSSIHTTTRACIDDHDIDLTVIGTHGRTGFDRYVLGSVTEQLVRASPIPVLTVREHDGEPS